MLAVLLLSVDLAWIRLVLPQYRSAFGLKVAALDAGVVPMANLVIVGLYFVITGSARKRSFALGFTCTGICTLIVFLALARTVPTEVVLAGRKVYVFTESIVGTIPTLGGGNSSTSRFVDELLAGSVMFSTPQAGLAAVGGVLACLVRGRGTRSPIRAG
jgi:hypothetical protein